MSDTLERDRLVDNLIDRLFRLEEEVARLKEQQLQKTSGDVVFRQEDSDGLWTAYVKDMGGEVGPVIVLREL